MRLSPLVPSSLLFLLFAATDAAAQRGVVNGLTITPATATVGATITATVSGVNPCGAVLVDWGDGTAVTHPIVEVPVTRTHTYAAAGNYSVTARGQGNCDGEAAGTVRINPAASDVARRELSAFSVSTPTAKGAPVSLWLRGEGTCTIDLSFGDGDTQRLTVPLPHTVTHIYAESRLYNVTAAALSPCQGGRHTARLEVTPGAAAARAGISAVTIAPDEAGGATIDIAGTGNCSYRLDYGDGNRERRTATLPDRVDHIYPSSGTFIVVATAEAPCEGRVRETFRATRARASLVRVVVSPNPALPQSRVSIAVEGSGTCPVTVDFGDGADQSIEGTLPLRVFHSYARPGRYEVFAWTEAPCSGDARTVVQVRR
jgi:hypothetical protein